MFSTSKDKRGSDMPSGKFFKGLGKSNSQANMKTLDDNYLKRKKLPENFAEDLLNLELDAEQENVEIKTIMKLLELYANAVEYYESMHNDRYKIFQSKMNGLMRKPNIIAAMNKEMGNKACKQQSEEEKIRIQKSVKRKEMEMNLYYAKENAIMGENPKKMIEGQRKEIENSKDIIQKEIDSQKQSLLKRLEERKMKARAMQFHKSTSDPVLLTREKRKSIKEELIKPLDYSLLNNTINEEELSDSDEEEERKQKLKQESKRKSIVMLKRASKDLTLLLEKKNIINSAASSERKSSSTTRPVSSSITKIKRDMEKKGNTIKEEEHRPHEWRSKNDLANPDSDSEESDSEASSFTNTRKNTEQIEKSTELSLNLLPVIDNSDVKNIEECEEKVESDGKCQEATRISESPSDPSLQEKKTAETPSNNEITEPVSSLEKSQENLKEEEIIARPSEIPEEKNTKNTEEINEIVESKVPFESDSKDLTKPQDENSKDSNIEIPENQKGIQQESGSVVLQESNPDGKESQKNSTENQIQESSENISKSEPQELLNEKNVEAQLEIETEKNQLIQEEPMKNSENSEEITKQEPVLMEDKKENDEEAKADEGIEKNITENQQEQENKKNPEYEEKYLEVMQKFQKKIDEVNQQIAEKGSNVIMQKILKKAESDRDKELQSLKLAYNII